MGTDVNGTAVKNDGPTQPNWGRVAVSFRVGDSNKVPNDKCEPSLKYIPPPAKQTYHFKHKQTKHEENKAKGKLSARSSARHKLKGARLSSSLQMGDGNISSYWYSPNQI